MHFITAAQVRKQTEARKDQMLCLRSKAITGRGHCKSPDSRRPLLPQRLQESGKVASLLETLWTYNVPFCQKRVLLFFFFPSVTQNHSSTRVLAAGTILPCCPALLTHPFKEMLKEQQGPMVTKALYSQFSIPLGSLVFLLLNCNKLTSCI